MCKSMSHSPLCRSLYVGAQEIYLFKITVVLLATGLIHGDVAKPRIMRGNKYVVKEKPNYSTPIGGKNMTRCVC